MLQFDIVTLFPEGFSYLNESILGRAQKKELIKINIHNLRSFAEGKHKIVDDRPYGGGAGMVLMAPPILRAVEHITSTYSCQNSKRKVILLSPKGRQFSQQTARTLANKFSNIILISGRYEGIDERVKKALRAEEVSVGPYILTDGDIAAMIIVSVVARLVPGVLGSEASLAEESFAEVSKIGGRKSIAAEDKKMFIEYPQYTRPEVFEYKGRKYRVPKILLSGDHKKIKEWRTKHSKCK